jgi:hypothetical protein
LKKIETDTSQALTTFANNISFSKSISAPSLTYTGTFATPTAGQLGYVSSNTSAITGAITSGTNQTMCSLTSLAAGVYVISGTYSYACGTAGTIAIENISVGGTSIVQIPTITMAIGNTRINSFSYLLTLTTATTVNMNMTLTITTGAYTYSTTSLNALRIA